MIYFIETQGMVKIGYSKDPRRLFHNLSIGCPTRCSLIAVIEGSMEDEQNIHELFKANRVRGEWFTFTPEINSFIGERAVVPEEQEERAAEEVHPLEQYLKANKIGVTEFAGRVGLSRYQIWRIMSGWTTTIDTMFKIIEATGGDVSSDDFMDAWAAKRQQSREAA